MSKYKIRKISGIATLVDIGRRYPYYRPFADAAGYPSSVSLNNSLGSRNKGKVVAQNVGKIVRLLAKGMISEEVTYVAETREGERFLIAEDGLSDIKTQQQEEEAPKEEVEDIQIPVELFLEIYESTKEPIMESIKKAYAEGYKDGRKAENNR